MTIFSKKELEEIYEYRWDINALTPGFGFKIIDSVEGDIGRWTQKHEVIFQEPHFGKFYALIHEVGLTEYQEDYISYNPKSVRQVVPKDVTVRTWVNYV